MPWGTLKDQWERRTALKIAVRQTLSPQMSVRQTWTVDWFANMFANLSTAHDHWFSTARPLRLRPTPWGTRKVILRPPRISAVNCPQTARTVDVCVMWPGLKPWSSPGHIRHPSAVRAVCGQFTAENRRITLRVPQAVGLNRRGCAVENQWSWAVERFANMFANQSTVRDLPTDICWLSVWRTAIFKAVRRSHWSLRVPHGTL